MTDEIKQDEDVEEQATETEAEVKPTGGDQTKKPTAFTQEDVTRVVTKEKAAWKKSTERLTADHETIVQGLRADLDKRDEVIKENVALLVKDLDIPAEDWEFIADGKDVIEQYSYLLKKMDKAAKDDAQFPRTPQGKKQKDKFQSNFKPNL